MAWAKFLQKHPPAPSRRIRKPFVIGAIIDLGNCLDLSDAGSLTIIQNGYAQFKAMTESAGAELPVNQPAHDEDTDLVKRHLDCAVVNFVHLLRERSELQGFDTVRGIFTEGGELYPGVRGRSFRATSGRKTSARRAHLLPDTLTEVFADTSERWPKRVCFFALTFKPKRIAALIYVNHVYYSKSFSTDLAGSIPLRIIVPSHVRMPVSGSSASAHSACSRSDIPLSPRFRAWQAGRRNISCRRRSSFPSVRLRRAPAPPKLSARSAFRRP